MTSIVITRNASADYVYNTATFQWDSIEGDETWSASSVDAWDIAIGEDLTFVEAKAANYAVGSSEAFNFVETIAKDMVLPWFTESITFLEDTEIFIPFNLSFNENMNFVETIAKDMVNQLADSFAFSDVASKDVTMAKTESWSTAEVFSRSSTYNLDLPEAFAFVESRAMAMGLSKAETISIIDEYIRRANAVISDLVIDVGDITTAAFTNLLRNGRPAGHTEFIRYMPGDYNYEFAVYRAKMSSANNIDKGIINTLQLEVDVPDLIESGTSVIAVAGTGAVITFAKTFHITPDINVSFKGGGSAATAEYSAESSAGFTAHLRDTGGTLVTGTVSWAVRGY